MTFTEAAVEVLRLVGKPLHYKKITELAIERNLLSHVGKTPEITMSSRLATMVKKDRGDAPIIKVKPGVFGLRDFPEDVIEAADQDTSIELDALGASGEEADEEAAVLEEVEASEGEAPERAAARSEHKLPGAEVFPEEEDDDEPILAKLDEEAADRDDDPNKRRNKRRRRKRRKGEEDGDVAEASEGDRRPREAGDRSGREAGDRRGRDGRGRDRERDRDRDRGRPRDERRRELPGDWHREPAEGDLVGKDLSDSIVAALEAGGGARPRPLVRVAEELVRRGRLAGDPAALVPTLAAASRGDDARRLARHRRPRFRIEGDEIALLEWSLPQEAARAERDVEQAARRQRDHVRRAFVRKLAELPTAGLMELLATWLNVVGVSSLRGIRRPGAASGELHLAGVLKQGPLETPLAIVIVRDGASIGRERVIDVRGGLHHYGGAAAAWLITLGQVLSGAREEAATQGAAPCALFDGQELAISMEEAGIGLRSYVVPVAGLDLELLESLRGPGARPAPRREPEPRREAAPERASDEGEDAAAEEDEAKAGAGEPPEGRADATSAEASEAGGGNGRRRRRRRRGRRGAEEAAPEAPVQAAIEGEEQVDGGEGAELTLGAADELEPEEAEVDHDEDEAAALDHDELDALDRDDEDVEFDDALDRDEEDDDFEAHDEDEDDELDRDEESDDLEHDEEDEDVSRREEE
jgi:hypothetical protein